MGENFYCDYQISDSNELIVKGDICIYDDWFSTGDLVIKKIKYLHMMQALLFIF